MKSKLNKIKNLHEKIVNLYRELNYVEIEIDQHDKIRNQIKSLEEILTIELKG